MKAWGFVLILLLFAGCVGDSRETPPPSEDIVALYSPPTTTPTPISAPTYEPAHPDPETDNATGPLPTSAPPMYEPAHPDPETDNITWTLPTGASPLRLGLPADIDDIFYDENTGVGGYGLHAGGHPEGLDHVWIELRYGVPVKSWADGVVTGIGLQGMKEKGETHITIDYGQNLMGIHMEVETPYVKVGDRVKRGQEVGVGMSFAQGQSSAEMSLIDSGRTDGVRAGNRGVYVSPYDYLEGPEKKKLVEAYKKYVLEPYEKTKSPETGVNLFEPHQPYLTNKLFLHEGREGKLSGEWYFTGKWAPEYPNDLITFIEAEEPYHLNIVLAQDDVDDGKIRNYGIRIGTFEADYEKGQLKITREYGPVWYGIFEIDESEDRAKLKIEYQENSYPAEFSENALTYIERSDRSRREDAVKLGMRDTY